MIYYYSGCGNSRWVAGELAGRLGESLTFIPQAMRAGEYDVPDAERTLGLVFPVYAWGVPAIVREFVRKMRISHPLEYVYMVCTCGDEAGYVYNHTRRLLGRKGLSLDYARSLIMPNTFLNMPGFHLDGRQLEQEKQERAKADIAGVASEIASHTHKKDILIGSMPFLKSYLIKPLFDACISDKRFYATDACVSCGTCVKVCPVENVSLPDGRPEWHHQCLNCMACYHRCPKNAIQIGKYTQGKGQYYYKNLF